MPDPTIYWQTLSPVGIHSTVGGIPLTGFMNGPISEPPNIEAIQASLPEWMAVLPSNKNGQFSIIDSTGKKIGYVDAQGVKWKITYDQNGKPMGRVPMQ
jgi:YD repeat-containing protein